LAVVDGVPVQIHGMDKDPFFALEGDIDAARELVETVGPELATLFVYPGDRHLFADSSLPSYDADAAALVVRRSRGFLEPAWLASKIHGEDIQVGSGIFTETQVPVEPGRPLVTSADEQVQSR
jgi:hypothetical protein